MLRQFARGALSLLYPARCAGCGAFGSMLCQPCLAGLERAVGPGRCSFCSARWDESGNCPRCYNLQSLTGIHAAFEMEGAARKLVHALKYEYVRDAAPLMAAHLALLPQAQGLDAFFAVPLHRSRLKQRGFNQAAVLLNSAGWTAREGLTRQKKTDRQVGMHERHRRANVAGAFRYDGESLQGLRVALIDDVVTTGATMEACAVALREGGAREVYGLAFARASYRAATPEDAIDD